MQDIISFSKAKLYKRDFVKLSQPFLFPIPFHAGFDAFVEVVFGFEGKVALQRLYFAFPVGSPHDFVFIPVERGRHAKPPANSIQSIRNSLD